MIGEISLWASLFALYVSIRATWTINFRPGKLVSNIPYLVMWQFSSWKGEKPTGEVCSRYITPLIWLGNVGALPVVIEELRLNFKTTSGEVIVYPVVKVGIEVVEDPDKSEGKLGLVGAGPMSGFVVGRGGEWRNEYAFHAKQEDFEKLVGEVVLRIEAREQGKRRWRTIHKELFNFGPKPNHLEPLKNAGWVSGSMRNYVYSKSWHERRAA